MSEALTPDAPETDPAAPAVAATAPVDGTAVADGSAGGANTNTVDAARFNGLMSAHQRALAELEVERTARAELEARIITKEKPTVADDAVLSEVQELRRQLQEERIEAAREKVLAKYPAIAPIADMLVADTPEALEQLASAANDRLSKLQPVPAASTEDAAAGDTTGTAAATDAASTTTPTPDASVSAPVIGGGSTTPAAPESTQELQAVLQAAQARPNSEGSWSEYWSAKTSPATQANLG